MNIYYNASFVTVTDLISNGGEGCTVFKRKPYEDHVTIVECGNTSTVGNVTISHDRDILVSRQADEEPKRLTTADLNKARTELFKIKMCGTCMHSGYKHLCTYGTDNWTNFREGNCPEYDEW